MSKPERPSITFGTDGWRGIIADDFTGANVRLVSQATVNYFQRPDVPGQPIVIVGYDNRSQSEFFALEAARIVAAAGFEARLSQQACSSPAVSYHCKAAEAKGGIMITASHNPPNFNGFKIKMGFGGSALPSVTTEIDQELTALLDVGTMVVDRPLNVDDKIRKVDLRPAYLDGLRKMVDLERIASARFRVVVDAMHGSGSGYLPEILRGAGVEVVEIRPDRNPVFGGINPEPITQNLGALKDAIKEHNADVGLAIDGDADRVGAMDAYGNFVDSHRIFSIVLQHLYEDRGMRGSVVKTVSATRLIDKLCAKYGLALHVVPIGFKNICEWMLKETVLIGGEESGGIGVLGFIPERDGPLMCLMILESMAWRKKRSEGLIAGLMAEFGPHEYDRVDLHPDPSKMKAVTAKLKEETFKELAGKKVADVNRMDGTKLDFEDGSWLLMRASGTEPIVRVYAKSSSQDAVRRLIDAGVGLVDSV